MMSNNHHFFLLVFNSFSVLNSLMFFNLLFSLFFFFKSGVSIFLIFSLIFISLDGILWWKCYGFEFNLVGLSSEILELGLKTGMILFISSEIFFFFSFFWSYFSLMFSPSFEMMFFSPPYLVEMFEFDKLPFVNTMVLLSSGISVTLSHMFLCDGAKFFKEFFLFVTIFLGILFTYFQLSEYSSSFFSLNDGLFGSIFFILTGFHGIHVMIGSFFLLYIFLKSVFSFFGSEKMLSFELASWYWHFVDVVWIFLFYFIYYLNF